MSHCWRKTSSPGIINSSDLSAEGDRNNTTLQYIPYFILFITSTYVVHLNPYIRSTIVSCQD